MSDFWVLFCYLFCLMGSFAAYGNVVLIGNNVTLSFDDIEANFGEFFFSLFFGVCFCMIFSFGRVFNSYFSKFWVKKSDLSHIKQRFSNLTRAMYQFGKLKYFPS